MLAYIARRLLLVIPTLFGIMVINFVIVQSAPGGPVEQMLAQISGQAVDATARISGDGGDAVGLSEGAASDGSQSGATKYRGSRGLEPELIADIEKLYGFDKPPLERFLKMMGDYMRFDFGDSFFRDQSVVSLVVEKCPSPFLWGCGPHCWFILSPYRWVSKKPYVMAQNSIFGPVLW